MRDSQRVVTPEILNFHTRSRYVRQCRNFLKHARRTVFGACCHIAALCGVIFRFFRVLHRAAPLPATTCPNDVGEECCIAYVIASTQSAQAGRNSCSCLPGDSPYIFREFLVYFILCVSLSLSLGDLPKGRVVPKSFRNRKSPSRL